MMNTLLKMGLLFMVLLNVSCSIASPIPKTMVQRTLVVDTKGDWTNKFNDLFNQNKGYKLQSLDLKYNPRFPKHVETAQQLFTAHKIDKNLVTLMPEMANSLISLSVVYKRPVKKSVCRPVSFFTINEDALWGCAVNVSLKNSYTFY